MTHHELATLLHEDATATEPNHGLDAMVPVRLGRRRLRARRARAAGLAAAAVVAVGVVAPLALGSDGSETGPSANAGTPWSTRVRAALEPSAGALPSVSVREQGTKTIAGLGTTPASWHFYTATADPAATLDDPAAYCRERMALGYVSCTVQHDDEGHPVVVQELAVVNVGAFAVTGEGHTWDLGFARARVDRLNAVNPVDRFFRREAVAVTEAGTLTVTEQLQARTPAAAAAAYVVPTADLVAAASDPDLATP